MKTTLTVDGKRYRVEYFAGCGLPEIKVKSINYFARGSSIGPTNPSCNPDASDRNFWRSLIRAHIERWSVASGKE